GCRELGGISAARNWWLARHQEGESLHADCLSLVDRCERMAAVRGWKLEPGAESAPEVVRRPIVNVSLWALRAGRRSRKVSRTGRQSAHWASPAQRRGRAMKICHSCGTANGKRRTRTAWSLATHARWLRPMFKILSVIYDT